MKIYGILEISINECWKQLFIIAYHVTDKFCNSLGILALAYRTSTLLYDWDQNQTHPWEGKLISVLIFQFLFFVFAAKWKY